jgi:hypothetical protein
MAYLSYIDSQLHYSSSINDNFQFDLSHDRKESARRGRLCKYEFKSLVASYQYVIAAQVTFVSGLPPACAHAGLMSAVCEDVVASFDGIADKVRQSELGGIASC